jgi:hypothetical protein
MDQIRAVGDGSLSLDALTRELIRNDLSFRVVTTGDAATAKALEDEIKVNGLPGIGRPFLNPGSAPD